MQATDGNACGDASGRMEAVAVMTLFGAIRHELLQLMGVPVDVLTPKSLPERFRAEILAEAVPV